MASEDLYSSDDEVGLFGALFTPTYTLVTFPVFDSDSSTLDISPQPVISPPPESKLADATSSERAGSTDRLEPTETTRSAPAPAPAAETELRDGRVVEKATGRLLLTPATHAECTLKLWANSASSTDFDDTGSIFWPSCRPLCQFIAVNREFFRGRSVLEMGCGLAAPSALLCKLKLPRMMVASDHMPHLVEYALRNIRENVRPAAASPLMEAALLEWSSPELFRCAPIPPPPTSSTSTSTSTSRSAAETTASATATATAPPAESPTGVPLDSRFDVVIASDVIYSSDAAACFFRSASHLLVDGGLLVMSHRSRWHVVDRALQHSYNEFNFRLIPAAESELLGIAYPSIPHEHNLWVMRKQALGTSHPAVPLPLPYMQHTRPVADNRTIIILF